MNGQAERQPQLRHCVGGAPGGATGGGALTTEFRVGQALAQDGDSGVELARLAFQDDGAQQLPDVTGDSKWSRRVDDNRDAAETLASLLRLDGHRVHVAYDGEHALTLAEQFLPQVALLDLGLPKLSGLHLARRMRADRRQTHLLRHPKARFGTTA